MFAHLEAAAARVDRESSTVAQALAGLRRLSLDEFGQVLGALPNERWPNLSKLLPPMTPEAVQIEWTGSSGDSLLRQSVGFMNTVVSTYNDLTGRPIFGRNVLDFGCGWGRLLRLLSYFNNPEFNYGCDAWQASLDHSEPVKSLAHHLAKSGSSPSDLPFGTSKFDLIYAFSIFTHLSKPSAIACMRAIRKSIAPNGVAVITVRPIEIWDWHKKIPEIDKSRLRADHQSGKYAFYPSIPGSEYGDASIPLELIPEIFGGWELIRVGATLIDPYQIFVTLRPV